LHYTGNIEEMLCTPGLSKTISMFKKALAGVHRQGEDGQCVE